MKLIEHNDRVFHSADDSIALIEQAEVPIYVLRHQIEYAVLLLLDIGRKGQHGLGAACIRIREAWFQRQPVDPLDLDMLQTAMACRPALADYAGNLSHGHPPVFSG
jgi:hypothetical protein